MPSDAKKREQQRKKEAAKARQTGKKQQVNGKPDGDAKVQNGVGENGSTELSAEGTMSHFCCDSMSSV